MRKKRYAFGNIPLRTRIYGAAIILAIFIVLVPSASAGVADIFGFGTEDLYANITANVKETNDILETAFDFSETSPYDILLSLPGTQRNKMIDINVAIRAMALVVATLLLMVEFFRKTVNFEWSSKWENILIFLVKIIVIKQVVQNADVIVGYIYSGFNSINQAAIGGSAEFLPYGTTEEYFILKTDWLDNVGNFLGNLFTGAGNQLGDRFKYNISEDAVKLFYPNATFPSSLDLNSTPFSDPTNSASFNATLEMVLLQPYFLIMKGIAIAVFVIVIGRVFELTIYTIFAPLPLATFASDSTHDVGKSFIKNYIAVVLQITVIIVMFLVYVGVTAYFTSAGYMTGKFVQLIALISLGMGVIKSGAWSKKVCGIG